MTQVAELFQQWMDCGMINGNHLDEASRDLTAHFLEGNTAFWLGSFSYSAQNNDENGEQYGVMPYLSEDGTQNVYVT